MSPMIPWIGLVWNIELHGAGGNVPIGSFADFEELDHVTSYKSLLKGWYAQYFKSVFVASTFSEFWN
ncbi:hypothetical protein BpHYR1_014469 [Brachionus plicatilis]|uniref:Uncharacterized protein n=1 Tax=Brachionus plicatilis TaxID=10195 RepID=A0A3M7PY83_BRAPC|nr:hypothetical protein BpHYR1_014469 [Brachionus plicatilis]